MHCIYFDLHLLQTTTHSYETLSKYWVKLKNFARLFHHVLSAWGCLLTYLLKTAEFLLEAYALGVLEYLEFSIVQFRYGDGRSCAGELNWTRHSSPSFRAEMWGVDL